MININNATSSCGRDRESFFLLLYVLLHDLKQKVLFILIHEI